MLIEAKYIKNIFYTCFLALVCNANGIADVAANKATLSKSLVWMGQQQNPDGSWGPEENIRYLITSSVVDAFKSANHYSSEYYAGIAWLENHSAGNVDFLSRKIISLFDHGNNLTADINYLQNAKRNINQSGWGVSDNYLGSAIDSSLVLSALIKANEIAGQTDAVNYLAATQLSIDGGWSINGVQAGSDYWVTAKIYSILAEMTSPPPAVSTLLSNAVPFLETVPVGSSNLALAQTVIALHSNQGISSLVDSLITEILSRQTIAGDWGDVYSTATVAHMLTTVLGLDISGYSERISITDQTLQSMINAQLGKNAFDNLARGEILQLTSLDLTNTGVTNLDGLENATNLQSITVDSTTNISAISGLAGLAVTINPVGSTLDICGDGIDQDATGSDAICGDVNDDGEVNIADVLLLQRYIVGLMTLDLGSIVRGDLYPVGGDDQITLSDILLLHKIVDMQPSTFIDTDGDLLPDEWELLNSLDPTNANDAILDNDNDGLTNLQERYYGTLTQVIDTDGDGFSDGDEANAGSNPSDTQHYPITITSIPILNAQLGFSYSYILQADQSNVSYEIVDAPSNVELISNLDVWSVYWKTATKDIGSHVITIKASINGTRVSYQSFTLTINGLPGDINMDGQVDVSDSLLAQRHMFTESALSAEQLIVGDVYPTDIPDNEITISDILLLQKLILGEQ